VRHRRRRSATCAATAHVGVEFSFGDAGLLEVHDVKEVVAEAFREFRSADLHPRGWHAEREHRGDTLGVQQRDIPAQDRPTVVGYQREGFPAQVSDPDGIGDEPVAS
jgi:hypothetical protein